MPSACPRLHICMRDSHLVRSFPVLDGNLGAKIFQPSTLCELLSKRTPALALAPGEPSCARYPLGALPWRLANQAMVIRKVSAQDMVVEHQAR